MQLARLSHVSLGVQRHFHYHLPGILSRWRFLSYKRVNETTTQGGTGFHALKIAGELLAERTATRVGIRDGGRPSCSAQFLHEDT
jgi:hypothetical protein